MKQTKENNILTTINSVVDMYTPKFSKIPYYAIMDVDSFGEATNRDLTALSMLMTELKDTKSNVVTLDALGYTVGDSTYLLLHKAKHVEHQSVESEIDPEVLLPRDYDKREILDVDRRKKGIISKNLVKKGVEIKRDASGKRILNKAIIHSRNHLITNAEVFISSDIFDKYTTFPKKSRQITLLLLSKYMDKHINLLEVNIKKVAIELNVTNTQLLNALHSLVKEGLMLPIANTTKIRMNAKHTYRFIVDPKVAIHKPSNYQVIAYTYKFMHNVTYKHNDTISLGVFKEHITQSVLMVKALKKLVRLDSELERLQHQIAAVEKLGVEVPKPKGLTKNKEAILHRTFSMSTEELAETL